VNNIKVADELRDFQTRRDALSAEVATNEQEFLRLKIELADAQIERLFSPKQADTRIAKLTARLGTLQARLAEKSPELEALDTVVARFVNDLPAQRHNERLAVQSDLQARYGAALKRILSGLAEVAQASELARSIHFEARSAIPDHEKHPGLETVFIYGGCGQAWPPDFVSDGVNLTRSGRLAMFIVQQYPGALEFLPKGDPARQQIEAIQRNLREQEDRDEQRERDQRAAEAKYQRERHEAAVLELTMPGARQGGRGELIIGV
jgi:hypothetical protein